MSTFLQNYSDGWSKFNNKLSYVDTKTVFERYRSYAFLNRSGYIKLQDEGNLVTLIAQKFLLNFILLAGSIFDDEGAKKQTP